MARVLYARRARSPRIITIITFTGTVIGGNWEGLSTTIQGQWTGGDWICDPSDIIKNDPKFPNQGILTIYMKQDKDRDYIILDRHLGDYYYIFGPSGRTYVPSGAVPGAGGPGSVGPGAVEWPISAGGNGHYYEAVLVPGGFTWYDAYAAAEAKGGYLATITSEAENEFVYNLVAGDDRYWYYDSYGNTQGPWLGGYQPEGSSEPDGGWAWVNGEVFEYKDWAGGQPDNMHRSSVKA